jgi:hypothetical protein
MICPRRSEKEIVTTCPLLSFSFLSFAIGRTFDEAICHLAKTHRRDDDHGWAEEDQMIDWLVYRLKGYLISYE